MKYIDIQDKDIETAVKKGLEELQTTAENVEVTILKQPGLFSKAKVRLTLLQEVTPDAKEAEEVAQPQITSEEKKIVDVQAELQGELSTPAGNLLAQICAFISPDIKINESERNHNIIYTLDGEGSERLIGKGGQGIESLIVVLNAINRKHQEDGKHIVVRVAQYEQTKEERLKRLATESADKAVEINNTVRLPIMNSYERRIVHSYLQEDERVVTESFGVEPYRYTTVRPKDKE